MNPMKSLPFSLTGLALCAAALGQDPCVRFAPPPSPIVHMQMVDIGTFDQLLRQSKIGQMLTEGMLKEVADMATARMEEIGAEIEAVQAQIREMGGDDDLHQLEALMTEVSDLRIDAMDLYVYVDFEDGEPKVAFLAMAESGGENREALEKLLDKVREITDDEGEEAAPLAPLHDVKRAPIHLEDVEEGMTAWWLDTGTQTVFSFGDLDISDRLDPTDTPPSKHANSARVVHHAGMAMHVDLARIGTLIRENQDSDFANEFGDVVAALGVDGDMLSIGFDVDNGSIRENVFFAFENGARGLIAAMTTAADTPPNVPLPSPALLHWRGAMDMDKAFDAIRKAAAVTDDASIDDEDSPIKPEDLTATFSGGMALGLSAPKPGAMVPRIGMVARITSDEAFASFREKIEEMLEGIDLTDHDYKDVTWTSIEIPNNPAPMVPSFAVHNGLLLVGENPTTLKDMLKLSIAGDIAPPIDASNGPSPLPEALGVEADAALTYDLGATYEMIINQYMPMVQMGMGMALAQQGRGGEPLFTIDDLPDPEELAPELGIGVGSMTVTDDGLHVSVASSLGDPLLAMMAEFMGPLMGQAIAMGMEQGVSQAEKKLAKLRLEKVYSGLRNWQATWGSGKGWPRDLGELMGRSLIDDPTLLLAPGNEHTLTLEYENEDGDIEDVECSYQWRPGGKLKAQKTMLEIYDDIGGGDFTFWFENDDDEEPVTILLYEAEPGPRRGRMVLTDDGGIYHIPEDAFQGILNG